MQWRNWGPLAAEFPVDYASMIASFKNMTSKPKIWLMVPPPLYADGVYGMNQTVINTLFPGTGPHLSITSMLTHFLEPLGALLASLIVSV